jgi:hypothetical protein
MAKQNLIGTMQCPNMLQILTSSTTSSNTTLDANDEALAFIFVAPRTKNLRKIGFRTNTVTTGAALNIRIETVDLATGFPTGTLVGTTTSAVQTVLSSDDNTWFTVTLTLDASLAAGTAYAIVIANPSAAGGNLVISTSFGMITWEGPPYACTFLGAPPTVWSKLSANGPFHFYLEYDDGTTDNVGNFPSSSIAGTAFNNTTATRERALYFQLPAPVSVIGCVFGGDTDVGDYDVILYDSDGTSVLKSLSVDKELTRSASGLVFIRFATQADLLANTNYRLAIKPTSASNVTLYEATFSSTTIMAALDMGANAHLSTKDSGGTWTQTTTQRPAIALLISALDDGTGGGGAFPSQGIQAIESGIAA